VLLIVNRLAYGGAELQMTHLAGGLANLGHEVTVCCIDKSLLDLQSLRDAGVRVLSLGAHSRVRRMMAIPRLAILARRAEVVHCTMWDATLWGRIAAILARRPVIVADHQTDRSTQVSSAGDPRGGWIALHYRLLDRFTFATIACATSQRPILIGEGVDAAKIAHIPNGIPIETLVGEAASSDVTRADLGIPDDAKVAMQVGVFRPEKNQLAALEALAQVRADVPDVHLVFVGDGELRGAVEQRARELGGDWVHFAGFRADVPAVLTLADVLVHPSLADAMPMTVIEALALGVPVVAADVGDVPETLAGGAGVCVPAGDTGAFARACRDVLSDADLRADLARAGRERALSFDAAVMSERCSELLEAATGAREIPH
jgi:glycosyltransferase involved in cell wall biosynthesis